MKFPCRKICLSISTFAIIALLFVVMAPENIPCNENEDCSDNFENLINMENKQEITGYRVGVSIGNDLSIRL